MRKSIIRILVIPVLAGLALGAHAARAQSSWQSYVSHELGLSFEAPSGVMTEIGATLRGDIVGTKEQIEFAVEENNIEYRVGVANFAQAQMMSETILGEALFLWQGEKPILMDMISYVGDGPERIYGRKSTVELAQGGQATTVFYFANGKLYQLTATVSAQNGNYDSPDPMRFIDSVRFDLAEASPNSTELELPEY
jgi:hypothetical protein